MPVLPFHRYIGPGNDINNGPCVDEDDCIARKHDLKYETARTPRDVRLADVEAIKEFRQNWRGGNWHSLIGDLGLSLKYHVESFTGVIYPKLSPCQPCEVISLFHDLLKLHCLHNSKYFSQFSQRVTKILNIFPTEENITNEPLSSNTKEDLLFILVLWYHIHFKRSQQPPLKSTSMISTMHTSPVAERISHDLIKAFNARDAVNKCDIFQLGSWISFFMFTHVGGTEPVASDYDDEEFANMFVQLD